MAGRLRTDCILDRRPDAEAVGTTLRADMKEQPDPLSIPARTRLLPGGGAVPDSLRKACPSSWTGKTRYIDIPEPILDMLAVAPPIPADARV